ncbi:MAG: hypothetical protein WCX65_16165 [bacterium]
MEKEQFPVYVAVTFEKGNALTAGEAKNLALSLNKYAEAEIEGIDVIIEELSADSAVRYGKPVCKMVYDREIEVLVDEGIAVGKVQGFVRGWIYGYLALKKAMQEKYENKKI